MAPVLAGVALSAAPAGALDLDWSGQFRAEANWVFNYGMDSGNLISDDARAAGGGYYVPGGGDNSAYFQSAFLRLRPSLIVNDNIYVKSDWWVGNPTYGLFGDAVPYSIDQKQFYSTQSRGSFVTAQRLWGEFLSDIGTVQVGRAPLHWGLGLFWNSGEDVWSRYPSTGDTIRLLMKFGSFSFAPGIVKYSAGNNIGGACPDPVGGLNPDGTCKTVRGGGGMSDYSLQFKYDNPDEDMELGLNFVKRIAGAAQGAAVGYQGVAGAAAGMNFNIWDIYGLKRFGDLTFRGEVPITTGDIGSVRYNSVAAALEGDWQVSDKFDIGLRAGHAPGQPDISGTEPDSFKAFFFHPDYRMGLIMFNYQLRNFAGPNTANAGGNGASLLSPYDAPLVNANYLRAGGGFRAGKWRLHADWLFASALEAAGGSGSFFNYWQRKFVAFNGAAPLPQSKFLGWEMDYGATFFWDDSFRFDLMVGWFFPGDFYRFSNTAQENVVAPVFATSFRAGVTF